jgi:hypothetical protein
MHVLPLPFGMALALVPRREVQRFAGAKPNRWRRSVGAARDVSREETRYAAFRQFV